MTTQELIKDALDQIDHAHENGQAIDVSNLTAVNELRHTQRGQLVINALERYDSSSLENTTEKKAKKSRDRLLFNMLALQDQLLDDYLNLAEKYTEQANKNAKNAERLSQEIQETDIAAQEAIASLQQSAATPEDLQKLQAIKEFKLEISGLNKIALTKLNNVLEAHAALEKSNQNLSDVCGQGPSATCEEATDEYEKATIEFQDRMEKYIDITEIIADRYDVLAEKIDAYTKDKDLTPEQQETLDTLHEKTANIHKLVDELKSGNLTADELKEKLSAVQEAFSDTNELIKSHANNPEFAEQLAPFKDIVNEFSNVNDKIIDGISNTFDQDMQRLQELEQRQQELQADIRQFEQEKEFIEQAQRALEEKAEHLTEQYEDISRREFIEEQYGGTFQYHAILNGWDDHFSKDPETKHVTTEDGNVVFYAEDNTTFYYYPDNNPDADPVQITDKLEHAKIQIAAYEGDPPKPFGNDTRWGNQFGDGSDISNFFAHAGRLLIDGGLDSDELSKQNDQDIAQAKQSLDASQRELYDTNRKIAAGQNPDAAPADYHLEEKYKYNDTMSVFAQWSDALLETDLSQLSDAERDVYQDISNKFEDIQYGWADHMSKFDSEDDYYAQHIEQAQESLDQLSAMTQGATPAAQIEVSKTQTYTQTFNQEATKTPNSTPETPAVDHASHETDYTQRLAHGI